MKYLWLKNKNLLQYIYIYINIYVYIYIYIYILSTKINQSESRVENVIKKNIRYTSNGKDIMIILKFYINANDTV